MTADFVIRSWFFTFPKVLAVGLVMPGFAPADGGVGGGNGFVPCIVSMSVYDMNNLNVLLALYIGHTSNNV